MGWVRSTSATTPTTSTNITTVDNNTAGKVEYYTSTRDSESHRFHGKKYVKQFWTPTAVTRNIECRWPWAATIDVPYLDDKLYSTVKTGALSEPSSYFTLHLNFLLNLICLLSPEAHFAFFLSLQSTVNTYKEYVSILYLTNFHHLFTVIARNFNCWQSQYSVI